MLIEEIIRSCSNERVAAAAVASLGLRFACGIRDAAEAYGMSVGEFAALSVGRFARHGDEAEMRSVLVAMEDAQEPILAGLHRILSIMLAAGVPSIERRRRERGPRIAAQFCAWDEFRRERFA